MNKMNKLFQIKNQFREFTCMKAHNLKGLYRNNMFSFNKNNYYSFSTKTELFFNDEKNKSKFNKMSSRDNTANIPTEEENMANLLNEMKSIETSQNHNVLIQKNDILFFSNLDDNFKKFKLGQFIIINETLHAQCISIKDNLATFLLVNQR